MRIILLLALLAQAPSALASAKSYVVREGKASFTAKATPGFLTIKGEGGTPSGRLLILGDERLVEANVCVDLRKLKTGLAVRDQLMQDQFLEVKKYPEACFAAAALTLPSTAGTLALAVPGRLTMHGVTRAVTANFEIDRSASSIAGVVAFEVDLSDFGIATPSFSGLTMGREIAIRASFRAETAGHQLPMKFAH